MKKYIIETIDFKGCWYPTINKHEVGATCLEGALEVVLDKLNCYYDSDDIERLKEDCHNEWGHDKRSNELLALVYNQILDENDSDERIIKGYLGKKKIFDILD